MHFFLFLFLTVSLHALDLETVYGRFTIDDPLAIELIESEPFQRLKGINQYGFNLFLQPIEDYKRYEHSIGVYLLLREHGRSQLEQIAGLLHDVSHTVFSHVGDYVFGSHPGFVAYQDEIHCWYLRESGLAAILSKYNITPEELEPDHFPMLKNKLPNLCADRIDYNLQGGFLRDLITKGELEQIWQDLRIESDSWLLTSQENAETLANASLIMTETLWSSPWESYINRMGAQAIKQAIEKGIITVHEFHFSDDAKVWSKLENSQDFLIAEILQKMRHAADYFTVVEKGNEDVMFYEKFRGVNPLIKKEDKVYRLTELCSEFALNFKNTKEKMDSGWPIKFVERGNCL